MQGGYSRINGKEQETMESLARTKGESFEEAFRASIELEFRTQAEFARACGLSEGRISQIKRGAETPTAETLSKILKAFSSWALQERVHSAYVREFALLPPLPETIDDCVIPQIRALIDAGSARRAIKVAQQIRRQLPPSDHLWQRLSEEILEAQLKVEEHGSALRTLNQMLVRGKSVGKMGSIVTGFWQKSLILRAMPRSDARLMISSHQQAVDLLSVWKPADEDEAKTILNRRSALSRDHALNILRATNGVLSNEARESALRAVDYSESLIDDEVVPFFSADAKARIEIAAQNPFAAEEWIDTMDQLKHLGGIHGQIKRMKLEAETLELRKRFDEATEVLLKASRLALDHTQLHLHAQLQSKLAQILLREERKPF